MVNYLKRKIWGVHLDDQKNTADKQTVTMPLPESVTIALSQYTGVESELRVKVGDTVTVGQLLADCEEPMTVPLYSSVSGRVEAFGELALASGKRIATVTITTDKLQTPCPALAPPLLSDYESFLQAVRASGMVGLGGAGFPTHVKLKPPSLAMIDTLVLNGAECEPFITSDYRCMLEDTELLLFGLDTVAKFMGAEQAIITIEDNKKDLIEHLVAAIGERTNIRIAVVPTFYPQGAEKMMIYQVLNRVVPEGGLPADVGVVMLNVATITELGRYFREGMPIVSRRVTVDGGAIAEPQNLWVPLGTSIAAIAAACGGYRSQPHKIILGGPMMGTAQKDEAYPLLASTNAYLFFDESQSFDFTETACINCGRCTDACPMKLMPMILKKANERDDVEGLMTYKIKLCIECGCCSYVCPAWQELVQSHRESKAKVKREESRHA